MMLCSVASILLIVSRSRIILFQEAGNLGGTCFFLLACIVLLGNLHRGCQEKNPILRHISACALQLEDDDDIGLIGVTCNQG